MKISQFMAKQYANPFGLFGGLVTASILNRANKASNNAVYAALEIEKGDRVLEVGFGGAQLLFNIARQSGCSELCGLEISDVMLKRAQSLIQKDKALNGIKLSSGSIEALPFPEGSFDRVCSVNTVYFWSDLNRCAQEITRVTADKGKVVLGYGSGEKLQECGYGEKGFRFYHPDAIHEAMAEVDLNLVSNNRIERVNKDPFFVSVYCKDGR